MKYYIIENYINAFTFEEGKEIGFFIIDTFEYNGKNFEKESFYNLETYTSIEE